MKIIILLTILTLITLVLIATRFFAGWEESLTFFPAKYPYGDYNRTESPAMKIEDINPVTQDGLKLHGWIARPRKGGSDFWLLWFTGNGGNITYRFEWMERLCSIPLNVMIIDYRGYGKSEGSPTEEGIYKDADAAYQYLTASLSIHPDRIILLGESLGGAVAIDLASRVQCAGLIVQSTFTNAKDMAKRIMPVLPLWLVIRTKLDNLGKIQKVMAPKLFIHSPADGIVPYRLGRKLFEAAPEPKQFYEVPDAGHNETYLAGGQRYLNTIRDFVDSCKNRE